MISKIERFVLRLVVHKTVQLDFRLVKFVQDVMLICFKVVDALYQIADFVNQLLGPEIIKTIFNNYKNDNSVIQ